MTDLNDDFLSSLGQTEKEKKAARRIVRGAEDASAAEVAVKESSAETNLPSTSIVAALAEKKRLEVAEPRDATITFHTTKSIKARLVKLAKSGKGAPLSEYMDDLVRMAIGEKR